MFLNSSQRNGTAYYELQYCKKNAKPKILARKGYTFWEKSSLLVHIDDEEKFLLAYEKFFNSPNEKMHFDLFGVNYYSKEQSEKILKGVENEKPEDWQVFVNWLKNAVTEYNGFYILGI